MAVREFTDGTGREWRVWDVNPDALNPRTKDEDYLASLYFTGWLVFETSAGTEKRRLYPIPQRWNELPEAELEVLLQKSEVVPPRKLRTEKAATGDAALKAMDAAIQFSEKAVDAPEEVKDVPLKETPDVTDLAVVRTFRYPGGRMWEVCVLQHAQDGGRSVLRFKSGPRYLDLRDWPKDWSDYPDEELVSLLRRAAPRVKTDMPNPDTPLRRWDDPAPA